MAGNGPGQGAAAQYFPLATGMNWVLKNSVSGAQFSFEVVSASGNTYRVRCTTPWSTNDLILSDTGDQYWMTGYGSAAGVEDINALYLDFGSSVGTSWTNIVGSFQVTSRTASVAAAGVIFTNCIQITQGQGSSAITMTFAAGVGMVNYELGGQLFLLSPSTSRLPGSATAMLSNNLNSLPGAPDIGVVPNNYVTQVPSMQTAMNGVLGLAMAGARFLQGYGRWTALEPTQGNYQLDSLLLQVDEAQALNLASGYTFCVIDMANRNVPPELENLTWDDPQMQARVLGMVDVLAQNFGSQIQYFQFGNEADTYFQSHPGEVSAFAALLEQVKNVVHKRAPAVKVSVTLKFGSLGDLNGYLAPLNQATELLALTYGPYDPAFAVENPSVVAHDIGTMFSAAGDRLLYLQEMAYPSSAGVNSSEDLQADFVQNAFTALRAHASQLAAANFYDLADYSPQEAASFATSIGMGGDAALVDVIQSLGMFNVNAEPKKSWQVFVRQAQQAGLPSFRKQRCASTIAGSHGAEPLTGGDPGCLPDLPGHPNPGNHLR